MAAYDGAGFFTDLNDPAGSGAAVAVTWFRLARQHADDGQSGSVANLVRVLP